MTQASNLSQPIVIKTPISVIPTPKINPPSASIMNYSRLFLGGKTYASSEENAADCIPRATVPHCIRSEHATLFLQRMSSEP
jgi:hypothetical protein